MADYQNPPHSNADRNNRKMLWVALAVLAVVVIGYLAYAANRNNTQTSAYGTNDSRGAGRTATGTTNP
jgi:hypothetical protein